MRLETIREVLGAKAWSGIAALATIIGVLIASLSFVKTSAYEEQNINQDNFLFSKGMNAQNNATFTKQRKKLKVEFSSNMIKAFKSISAEKIDNLFNNYEISLFSPDWRENGDKIIRYTSLKSSSELKECLLGQFNDKCDENDDLAYSSSEEINDIRKQIIHSEILKNSKKEKALFLFPGNDPNLESVFTYLNKKLFKVNKININEINSLVVISVI